MRKELITIESLANSVVPITRFHRNGAKSVFDEVSECGFKLVTKNNKTICVMLSPERYELIMTLLMEKTRMLEAIGRGG